jgi:hypothetical protein
MWFCYVLRISNNLFLKILRRRSEQDLHGKNCFTKINVDCLIRRWNVSVWTCAEERQDCRIGLWRRVLVRRENVVGNTTLWEEMCVASSVTRNLPSGRMQWMKEETRKCDSAFRGDIPLCCGNKCMQ